MMRSDAAGSGGPFGEYRVGGGFDRDAEAQATPANRCVAKGPTGRSKILQIHPTRLCNLRCRHCYSASGPQERGALGVALLIDAIDDAAALGYGVVSLSGGEPLLYPHLLELLDHAGRRGLFRTFTTNGTLLDERRLASLRDRVDLLAISVDGPPAAHDALRGEGAFAAMHRHLAGLRRSDIPFGFIFTLTQSNVADLREVAQLAQDEGARLLQIHPLEEQGRAASELIDATPDAIEGALAHLHALHIERAAAGGLFVQVDLVNRPTLLARPELLYADDTLDAHAPLSHVVSPLIIEADASVVPLQYGIARRYALGNLREHRLARLAERWQQRGFANYRALCRAVWAAASAPDGPPYLNWFDAIGRASRSAEFHASEVFQQQLQATPD